MLFNFRRVFRNNPDGRRIRDIVLDRELDFSRLKKKLEHESDSFVYLKRDLTKSASRFIFFRSELRASLCSSRAFLFCKASVGAD